MCGCVGRHSLIGSSAIEDGTGHELLDQSVGLGAALKLDLSGDAVYYQDPWTIRMLAAGLSGLSALLTYGLLRFLIDRQRR